MNRSTGLPSTVESRLIEDAFEAFQFDVLRDLSIGNRQIALGVAALLLREEIDHSDCDIAALLKCATKSIPDLIMKARMLGDGSPEMQSMIESLRRKVPLKPESEVVVEKKRKQGDLTMRELALFVSENLDVPLESMHGDTQGLSETNARFIVIAVAKVVFADSKPNALGAHFKRDASLAAFAIRRVSNALKLGSGTTLHRDTLRICNTLNIDPDRLIIKNRVQPGRKK